jgi:hypothetical protein
MTAKLFLSGVGVTLCCFATCTAHGGNDVPASTAGTISVHRLAQVMPGTSTKTQVLSLLGAPWRIVQFNDCGHAMPGQADETWDYRGKDAKGTYRIHIEFDDHGVADLVVKIPDIVDGGKGTTANVAPTDAKRMQMSAKSMQM